MPSLVPAGILPGISDGIPKEIQFRISLEICGSAEGFIPRFLQVFLPRIQQAFLLRLLRDCTGNSSWNFCRLFEILPDVNYEIPPEVFYRIPYGILT